MYESSCSYQGALELKRSASTACPLGIKTEDFGTAADWPTYRFCNPSTFEQLKQSVEKAKAALQDRSGFFGNGSAFSDLYNVSTGRSQDSIQDSSSRLRDNSENDIKRSDETKDQATPLRMALPGQFECDDTGCLNDRTYWFWSGCRCSVLEYQRLVLAQKYLASRVVIFDSLNNWITIIGP